MPRRADPPALPLLARLDREAGGVGRQLLRLLRDAITRGELAAGERLPSTRALALSIGLARGTVTEVYDQLAAEGYLDARVGAGTRVAAVIELGAQQAPSAAQGGGAPPLSLRAQHYAALAHGMAPLPPVPFAVAVPAGEAAPDDQWRKLGNRVRASRAAAPATYADPQGVPALREAIADYLRRARAVTCDPAQILITAGTQQGLYLAAKVLAQPGDTAWAEDPAYLGLIAVLEDRGLAVRRLPVDHEGMRVEDGVAQWPRARAAFVSPSHQFPLGMPMSMARRMALIAWAREAGAYVVEDDYDSELRYAGHPFPSMQGLDPSRVVYLGTLSKVMFPSLRLGYLVAPSHLVDAFVGARTLMDRHAPTTEQHVLAAYMREGLFEAHIRRIRGVYGERLRWLEEAMARHLAPWGRLEPGDQGMHRVLWLAPGIDDVAVVRLAAERGLALRALSPMYGGPARESGLMMGFGAYTRAQIETAAAELGRVCAAVAARAA